MVQQQRRLNQLQIILAVVVLGRPICHDDIHGHGSIGRVTQIRVVWTPEYDQELGDALLAIISVSLRSLVVGCFRVLLGS